jgi:hypothetical protein
MKNFIVGQMPQPEYLWDEPLPEQVEGAARRKEFAASIAAIVKRAQDFSSNEEFWRKLLGFVESAKRSSLPRLASWRCTIQRLLITSNPLFHSPQK